MKALVLGLGCGFLLQGIFLGLTVGNTESFKILFCLGIFALGLWFVVK